MLRARSFPSALATPKRKRISRKDPLTPDRPVAYEEAKYIPFNLALR